MPSKRAHKSLGTQEESSEEISGQDSDPLIDLAGDFSVHKGIDFDHVKVTQVTYQNNYLRERLVNEPSEQDIFSTTTVSFLNG